MIANQTLFACGNINLGPGFTLLILGVLALWGVAAILFGVNLCLLFELHDSPLLRNGSGLLLYIAAGLAGYSHLSAGSGSYVVLIAFAFGLPAVVIGHFIWLLRLVRRERRALRAEAPS